MKSEDELLRGFPEKSASSEELKGVIGSDEPKELKELKPIAPTMNKQEDSMQAGHSALTPKPEGLITPLTPLTPQEKSVSSVSSVPKK